MSLYATEVYNLRSVLSNPYFGMFNFENNEENLDLNLIPKNDDDLDFDLTPEEYKPQTIAAIEKKLYEWASASGGVMIKKERDTYVYVFEQQYLQEMENNKFTILDEIKEIDEMLDNIPMSQVFGGSKVEK